MRIGIDFGGVIVQPAEGNSPIDPGAGLELMVPGAFEGVTQLVQLSEGNVWVVSKASMATQTATRRWLGTTGFFQATGFKQGNIQFCAKRHEKAEICDRLQLTYFVDDSEEVLQYLVGVVPNLIHFGSLRYQTWKQVVEAIQAMQVPK